jgi:hypothetical protein
MPCLSAVLGLIIDRGAVSGLRFVPNEPHGQIAALFIRSKENRRKSDGITALVISGDFKRLDLPGFAAICRAIKGRVRSAVLSSCYPPVGDRSEGKSGRIKAVLG